MWSFSWLGQKVKGRIRRLLASLNGYDGAEFEDDYVVLITARNRYFLLCIPENCHRHHP